MDKTLFFEEDLKSYNFFIIINWQSEFYFIPSEVKDKMTKQSISSNWWYHNSRRRFDELQFLHITDWQSEFYFMWHEVKDKMAWSKRQNGQNSFSSKWGFQNSRRWFDELQNFFALLIDRMNLRQNGQKL